MSTPSPLKSAKHIGDFVTGAQYDQSGLTSSLHEYLHGVGHEPFHEHARTAGLEQEVKSWSTSDSTEITTEDTVRALLPKSAIDHFAHETGLTENAVVTTLQEVLPKAVRRMAKRHEEV
ncbi:hypothetical protein AA103196_1898 [Ameyamaea chiangmaiensis NBRC 103196]|uniref:DUF937 domain-containing protein n=1 Tax=Ameyamaea chiangmaiensis TaxID=442969 RepID=A0A850PC38_9PROT|nr:YidB family protein [Ameyamaea chiangmaiensis]MBS4073837.1 hypothetical protein [Ameyamaea chiangmaiensis]NVN41508.1 hypothetical protein [Ameyamaea chiangmaiensis]GBQ68242.1 hypothetical protein AA103196_1898 [Ameyamaea chiangmaiensis NBRC 103196]